jgi:hypothetical protein
MGHDLLCVIFIQSERCCFLVAARAPSIKVAIRLHKVSGAEEMGLVSDCAPSFGTYNKWFQLFLFRTLRLYLDNSSFILSTACGALQLWGKKTAWVLIARCLFMLTDFDWLFCGVTAQSQINPLANGRWIVIKKSAGL